MSKGESLRLQSRRGPQGDEGAMKKKMNRVGFEPTPEDMRNEFVRP